MLDAIDHLKSVKKPLVNRMPFAKVYYYMVTVLEADCVTEAQRIRNEGADRLHTVVL